MAGETIITVVGNLTDDPELKFTPSGAAVANFTVASTPRTFDRQTNEWRDGNTLFVRCAAWRNMAENVAGSLQKGQRVIVTGAFSLRNFERTDGSKGTSAEINVDEVGPSLKFATAQVTRISRSDSGGGFGGGNAGGGGGSNAPQGGGNAGGAADPWGSAPAASSGTSSSSGWDTDPSAGGSNPF